MEFYLFIFVLLNCVLFLIRAGLSKRWAEHLENHKQGSLEKNFFGPIESIKLDEVFLKRFICIFSVGNIIVGGGILLAVFVWRLQIAIEQ